MNAHRKRTCPFRFDGGGFVKLAREWPRGKVANKARIPVAPLSVARFAATGAIFARLVFMDCARCGAVCRCHSEPPPPTSPRWRPDARNFSASGLAYAPIPDATLEAGYVDPEPADLKETRLATGRQSGAEGMGEIPATLEAAATSPGSGTLIPEAEGTPHSPDRVAPTECVAEEIDPLAWRDELSARLTRYRARRKIRPPRYPSLRLRFDPVDYSADPEPQSEASSASTLDPVSDHAFAEDGLGKYGQTDGLTATREEVCESQPREAPAAQPQQVAPPRPHSGAKIIEFPRFGMERFEVEKFNFEPPPPPPDQLAEPVAERIRILEVPEVEAPPPALGGITIAPAPRQDAEKRPGIDIPLQSASLARRILASLVDGLTIFAASALSGFIFWKVAAIRPPLAQMLGFAAGVPCLFWAVFQYLLIVYAGRTPGLRAFGLELTRFDGRPASRSLRRWRVLASYLSAASLGMGYAWVFLDEDALCWHDRITHTYLAPGKRQPKPDGVPKT
jgi:uncharacterized RDD family membrane protein YckC